MISKETPFEDLYRPMRVTVVVLSLFLCVCVCVCVSVTTLAATYPCLYVENMAPFGF